MEYWINKIAIVTGAGQGIGAKIAEDFVRAGITVIGFENTADNVDKMLNNVRYWGKVKGQLVPCKCDISIDKDLINAFEGIVSTYGGVDLLINNAATGKTGLICTGEIQDMKHVIDVNLYGLIACTRLAINSMIKKGSEGLIININSISGHYIPCFAKPTINMYIATKQAMTAMNTVIRNELKTQKHKIKLTSISPGIVRTGLFKRANIDFINDEFFDKNPHMTVEDVSRIVLMILGIPRSVHINEVIFHALNEIY